MNMDHFINEVKHNSIELNDFNRSNAYNFIKTELENKKYIFIGESSHCVKEYTIAKVNLIKFLHQKMGFKIIAFESELGDCMVGDYLSTELDAFNFMYGSIGRIWHNEYTLELFNYIQENKKENPLYLTGIDVQQSENKHFSAFLTKHFKDEYYKKLFVEADKNMNKILNLKRIKKHNLLEEVNEIKETINILINKLEIRPLNNGNLQKVLIRTLINRTDYLNFIVEKGFSKEFQYREKQMARNFEFIAQELYPNEKIIIWAHNLHVKRKSSINRFTSYSSFFENLHDSIKDDSLVLGLYAHKGRMGDYNGSDYPIKKSRKKNLEWLLSHSPYEKFFIKCNLNWGQKNGKYLREAGYVCLMFQ
ncbi:erythromycin esterase family protein [Lysinibacillus sp. NPDC094403]|uniref:erythromycin esterase family protein n=1 Tax=Lysinibacillus sp. NPDC094403 TaxID=3390581 RepID=UPI003D08563A